MNVVAFISSAFEEPDTAFFKSGKLKINVFQCYLMSIFFTPLTKFQKKIFFPTNHSRHSKLLCILLGVGLPYLLFIMCFLFFVPQSYGDEKTTASMLANKISFISAFDAKEYVPLFRKSFRTCLDNSKNPNLDSQQCYEKAISEVTETALQEPKHQKRRLRDRMGLLRRKDHISGTFSFPNADYPTVGVVGDSLAVGAMAAEYLDPHFFSLLGKGLFNFLLLGQNPMRDETLSPSFLEYDRLPPSSVVRIFDSPTSHKTGIERYFENKGSSFIDCEECSFPYTVAKSLEIPSSNIFVAGQSGKRINTIETQMERLTLPLEHLPDSIIVSYTANDICHPENANITPKEKYEDYFQKLVSSFDNSLSIHSPAPQGTVITIVASADVGNLLKNKKILEREISHYYPGGPNKPRVTCRDLRTQSVGGAKEIANMCPYILKTNPDDTNRINHIKSLHSAIVQAQKDAVAELNQRHNQKEFKFQFSDSILDIEFEAEDISPDCFHPSARGHDKIAKSVLKDLGFY